MYNKITLALFAYTMYQLSRRISYNLFENIISSHWCIYILRHIVFVRIKICRLNHMYHGVTSL